MNWDAIGAIGEVAGALAVVATLGYLAIQVKHAKAELQGVRLENVMTDYAAWYRQLAQRDAAAVRAKGSADYDSLTTEEKIQFHALGCQLMTTYEQSRVFWTEGIFPDDQFQAQENWMLSFLNTPGASQWWEETGKDWPEGAQSRLKSSRHWPDIHPLSGKNPPQGNKTPPNKRV